MSHIVNQVQFMGRYFGIDICEEDDHHGQVTHEQVDSGLPGPTLFFNRLCLCSIERWDQFFDILFQRAKNGAIFLLHGQSFLMNGVSWNSLSSIDGSSFAARLLIWCQCFQTVVYYKSNRAGD